MKTSWKWYRDAQAKYLRDIHRSLLSQRDDCEAHQMPQAWLMLTLLVIGVILIVSHCNVAHAAVSDEKAIQCIIGESESEGSTGMAAIAYAIINRGNIKGVFGCKSKRVINMEYSDDTWNTAMDAWRWAVRNPDLDITNGATGWGNNSDIRTFARHAWWNHCDVTVVIGNHTFYKCN